MTKRAPLTVTLSAAPPVIDLHVNATQHVTLAADSSDRTITGDITVYNTPSTTQGVVIHDGALTPRDPINRVKMLRDHAQSDPVGYMTDFGTAGLGASFFIPEGENGDRALAEAQNGLRDGLSIGFHTTEYAFDDDFNFHVYAAELYEVSLCAIPDMQSARVTDVSAALAVAIKKEIPKMNRAQLAAALSAGTISQDVHDREVARLDQADAALAANVAATQPVAPVAQTPEQIALAAGPTVVPQTPQVQVREPRITLAQAAQRVATAARSGRAADIALALTDIIPADDPGEAFIMRPDWIGELFQARGIDRPWINSFGVPGQLTSMKREGYRITGRPRPSKYAGNKTPVAGLGKFTAEKADFENTRWAGGADIDRAFVDFANETFLTAYWDACVEEYNLDSDTDVGDKVMDYAAENNVVVPTLLPALVNLASRGRAIKGSQINRIILADDLFEQYANLKASEVPFWLANATTAPLDLTTGEGDVAQLHIRADADIPAGNIVAYDTRAAKVLEKSPIQVRAVDIAKGGIDLGFFSYGAFDVHDPRLFLSATVGAATPLAPADGVADGE